MYEFTFLTPDRGAGFVKRLEAEGLSVSVSRDPMAEEATTISIPDDISDELVDRIEGWYEEETQAAEAELFRDGRAEAAISAGVWVTLADGRSSFAPIEPSIMSRMLSVLSPDEVGEFVDRVAKAVECPDDTPACARRED
ncbi:hypothetical protein LV475_07940 [Guyparkeria hydrothermalis]|uniref:Uncharacterized protein n=1 Tax=Guyparkeria halophila TaxID=47960 RepID=A0A6I6D3R2_9GAMM|nr:MULTISPECIES: hypothetical protein [Guyparkeria]MCL7751522.1 hypothetical protein [Guyparkeria hydrothermalis]QGT77991.1 hypothetical protein GM160_03265 [Guyparkeria halophila]TKA90534.1 hypothetical protein FAZ79_03795 [Guyparkeria sp. SB14A]